MEEFKCTVCGQTHDFSDVIDFGLPRQFVIDMHQGKLDFESNERWFIIDNKFFLIKCSLTIPINNYKDDFFWLLWISLKEDDFFSFIDRITSNSDVKEYVGSGKLFTEINSINKSLGEDVNYHLVSINNYPTVQFLDKRTELSKMSRQGISFEDAIRIISSIYH